MTTKPSQAPGPTTLVVAPEPSAAPEPIALAAPPSITLIGAGGFGINMVRKLFDKTAATGVVVRRFDTSVANVYPGEALHLISNTGDGSGADRKANAQPITAALASMTDDELGVADITIIIHSTAGGSGSVIGPLAAKELARRGCRVVNFFVADTISRKAADNTLGTLRTLEAVSTVASKFYFSVYPFTNDTQNSRSAVDARLPARVSQLIDMLRQPVLEVDKSDRLTFLDGSQSLGLAPGPRVMHLVAGIEPDDETDLGCELWSYGPTGTVYDAALYLGVLNTKQTPVHVPRVVKALNHFQGVFTQIKDTPMLALLSADTQAFVRLIKDVENAQTQFNTAIKRTGSVTGIDRGTVDDSGLSF